HRRERAPPVRPPPVLGSGMADDARGRAAAHLAAVVVSRPGACASSPSVPDPSRRGGRPSFRWRPRRPQVSSGRIGSLPAVAVVVLAARTPGTVLGAAADAHRTLSTSRGKETWLMTRMASSQSLPRGAATVRLRCAALVCLAIALALLVGLPLGGCENLLQL